MARHLLFFVILAVGAADSEVARACTCRHSTLAELCQEDGIAFTGRVESVEPVGDTYRLRVAVIRAMRGDVPEAVDVTMGINELAASDGLLDTCASSGTYAVGAYIRVFFLDEATHIGVCTPSEEISADDAHRDPCSPASLEENRRRMEAWASRIEAPGQGGCAQLLGRARRCFRVWPDGLDHCPPAGRRTL